MRRSSDRMRKGGETLIIGLRSHGSKPVGDLLFGLEAQAHRFVCDIARHRCACAANRRSATSSSCSARRAGGNRWRMRFEVTVRRDVLDALALRVFRLVVTACTVHAPERNLQYCRYGRERVKRRNLAAAVVFLA